MGQARGSDAPCGRQALGVRGMGVRGMGVRGMGVRGMGVRRKVALKTSGREHLGGGWARPDVVTPLVGVRGMGVRRVGLRPFFPGSNIGHHKKGCDVHLPAVNEILLEGTSHEHYVTN